MSSMGEELKVNAMREGQTLAVKVNWSPWEVATVERRTDGGGLCFTTPTRYVPDTDMSGVTMILLEEAR